MVNNQHPNEAHNPAKLDAKLDKPSPKSNSSNKATHGSLTSTTASSACDKNRNANSEEGQREAWALQKWLEQGPRDEPWRLGSRKA